ncbi:hypothetical protein Nepgr_027035 [Nepenthes gracilis]|uniref:Uncharacterized protein n=1 Tax=Nepenthes gracilis TaxID=150966 RepID=A0AAD3T997_NEPGR|nr:hypothetical protein Nepgr_027035 [Nepenthes gracilis]
MSSAIHALSSSTQQWQRLIQVFHCFFSGGSIAFQLFSRQTGHFQYFYPSELVSGKKKGQIARQHTTSSSEFGSGGAMETSNTFDVLFNCDKDVPSSACIGNAANGDQMGAVPLANQGVRLISDVVEQKMLNLSNEKQQIASCSAQLSSDFSPEYGSEVIADKSGGMRMAERDPMHFSIVPQKDQIGHRNVSSAKNDSASSILVDTKDYDQHSALPSAVRGDRADCKSSPQGLADQVNAPPQLGQIRSMKQALSLKPLKSILKKPKDWQLAFPYLANLVATDCRRVGTAKV